MTDSVFPVPRTGCACGHTCEHGPHEADLDHEVEHRRGLRIDQTGHWVVSCSCGWRGKNPVWEREQANQMHDEHLAGIEWWA